MRVIKLESNKVIEVKDVKGDYILQDGEIQSDTGELGQIMQSDGTFVWPDSEPVEPMPTLEEMTMQTLLNTEYLEILSEIENGGI